MDKKTIGKKNRESGLIFERKVRDDLIKKGFIISKWSNNVEILTVADKQTNKAIEFSQMIPAKHKFNPYNKIMSIGTGFPDFIAYVRNIKKEDYKGSPIPISDNYYIYGIECKSNGYLSPEEREKCEWYLNRAIFNQIFIASKNQTGEIIYTDFKESQWRKK